MQKQIESMMLTPKQIVENIDKTLKEKELNYEKKYKEALERAKQWLYSPNIDKIPTYGNKLILDIFPELKESEDERIRELCEVLVRTCFRNKLCTKEEIDKCIAWLEKQGEQEPANKVEPKFKVGDWICNVISLRNISSIENGMYSFDEGDVMPIEFVDKYYNLWTINDAEEGDVVVDKSNEVIGIFQSIGHHPDGGSYNDPSYCFLHCRYDNGFFYADFEHGNMIDSDDLIPATKEQRDTLFAEMKEAGYWWDAENKELKKIEKKGDEE